jgi:hypothetical protein
VCPADYDAVLTEAGDYTEKYFKLRNIFGSISGTQHPFRSGMDALMRYTYSV